MSRLGILIVIGALVIVSPFLGLPYSFLMWLLPVCGLLVASIAFSLRQGKTPLPATRPEPAHDHLVS